MLVVAVGFVVFWFQWKANRSQQSAAIFAAGIKSCEWKVKYGGILLVGASSPLY